METKTTVNNENIKQAMGETLIAVLKNVKQRADAEDLTRDDAELIRAVADMYRTVTI